MNRVAIMVMGFGLVESAVGQYLIQGPALPIVFSGPADGPLSSFKPPVSGISIGVIGSLTAKVKFKFDHVEPVGTGAAAPPNFVVISPSSGTAPTSVPVGLNEGIVRSMAPGVYRLNVVFTTVDQSPSSQAGVTVQLILSPPSLPPTIGSVLSSASFLPVISPGEMVSIFGTNLGPPLGATQYDVTGLYPTTLGDGTVSGNTTVRFGGVAAPLLYVSPNQINAVVPYAVSGQKTVDVVVTCYGQSTAAFSVPVLDTSPGIFTATQNGSGQGAILNVPANTPNDLTAYTYNSVENPAAKGAPIEFFATGAGVWNPPVQDGAINLAATSFTAQPVSLTIGGQPARILYAGSSPYLVWGVLQVNAFVPDGIGSGPQPLVLTIGQNDNSQQKVTIAIK